MSIKKRVKLLENQKRDSSKNCQVYNQ